MTDASDMDLVREFGRNHSEAAFTELVRRHLNLVYSIARRCTNNDSDAQDVAQAVFVILNRKAARLSARTVLTGWLYQTTRHTAACWQRTNARRHAREQEAYMQSTVTGASTDDDWRRLSPHLEAAMSQLGEADRTLLALRFYENKSGPEAAALLGIPEATAHKRTARAVEKLRKCFTRRGVTLSAAAIAAAISVHSVQAAPAELAAKVSALAVRGAAIGITTAGLVQGALKSLAWAKGKTFVAYGVAALIAGTAVIVVLPHPPAPMPNLAKPVAVMREPLADTMELTLETPPGALALQPDGKILVGTTLFGKFVDVQTGAIGFYNRGAFRLNPDGTLDRTFLCDVKFPGSAAQMARLGLAAAGRIFLSGLFGSVDNQPRPNYAMLLPDGRVDESFIPWREDTNAPSPFFLPKINWPTTWTVTAYQGGCVPAALLPDEWVAVMCRSVEDNTNSPYPPMTAYRLNPAGQWIRPATNILASAFRRPSGLIQTLGEVGFWARRPVDWTNDAPAAPRPPARYGSQIMTLAESRPVGDLPFDRWTETPSAAYAAIVLRALFEEVPMELCRYAARLPDGGTILAIRDKGNTGITAPGHFMRFDKNWHPDFSFTNSYEADLRSSLSIKRQKDGKFLVAGLVGQLNGEDFPGLVRLDEKGRIDRSFHCEIANSWQGRVMDTAIQEDGRIVICGFFSAVNGVAVPHLARLNPDGSLDQTFRTGFLSLEQFSRDRFAKARRVPVAQLTKPAPATNPAVNMPPTVLITSIRLKEAAVIEYAGTPRQQYILQANDSLNVGNWRTLSTNPADASGNGLFRDPDAKNHPTRFYRIATP